MNSTTLVRCVGEDQVELEISFEWEPIISEFVTGLPEDCSPRDGGFQEITSIKHKEVEILSLLDESDIFSDIEEICEKAVENMDSAYEH